MAARTVRTPQPPARGAAQVEVELDVEVDAVVLCSRDAATGASVTFRFTPAGWAEFCKLCRLEPSLAHGDELGATVAGDLTASPPRAA